MQREFISLLKNVSFLKRLLMVAMISATASVLTSLAVMKLADAAHATRISALNYRSDAARYRFDIVMPLLESYFAYFPTYVDTGTDIDLSSSQDSLAISRMRQKIAAFPKNSYDSYWKLFDWLSFIHDEENLLRYFRAWTTLPTRSAVHKEIAYDYYLYSEEDEGSTDRIYAEFGSNLQTLEDDDYSYFAADHFERVNEGWFVENKMKEMYLPAVDHYVNSGAYFAAKYYMTTVAGLTEQYNLKSGSYYTMDINSILVLWALFQEDKENLENYRAFSDLYAMVRSKQWIEDRLLLESKSRMHDCVVSMLNFAHETRHSQLPVPSRLEKLDEFATSFSSSCQDYEALQELASLLRMTVLFTSFVDGYDGESENYAQYNDLFLKLIEQGGLAEFRSFRSLKDDAAELVEKAEQHKLNPNPVVIEEDEPVVEVETSYAEEADLIDDQDTIGDEPEALVGQSFDEYVEDSAD
jgi:hypothetical protein